MWEWHLRNRFLRIRVMIVLLFSFPSQSLGDD